MCFKVAENMLWQLCIVCYLQFVAEIATMALSAQYLTKAENPKIGKLYAVDIILHRILTIVRVP